MTEEAIPLTIYKASAGSGKTYTLVKEYLKIVFKEQVAQNRHDTFRNVLAITFTKKAAAEMKERIIKYLIEISQNDNSSIRDLIEEETKLENLKELSQNTLKSILHNYSDFHVSTIDSFFQRIIKSYTRELKISMNYDIEFDNEKVLQEIVDKIFIDIESKLDLKAWMQDYMFSLLNDGKKWDFRDALVSFGKELFNEKYSEFQEYFYRRINNGEVDGNYLVLLKRFREELYKLKNSFEANMEESGNEALELIYKTGLDVNDFSYGASGVANYFNKIKKTTKKYEPTKRITEALNSADNWTTSSSDKREIIINLVNGSLNDKLRKIVFYYEDNYRNYITAKVCLNNLYQIGLFYELNKLIGDYRSENEMIFISDANMLLSAITKDCDSPFIYEKVGVAYKWFMIDEFQDTSNKQWENIEPLIKEAISNNNKVILVGDAKQSIYRWRGSNMNLINDVDFANFAKQELTLDTNYRSCSNIIKFNNTLFNLVVSQVKDLLESDESKEYLSIIYKDITQKTNNNNEGYVCVKQLSENSQKEFKEASLNLIPEYIEQCKGKGFQLKDIAIIVRSNNEGTELAQFLTKNKYPVVSSDALKIESSFKVKLILYSLLYAYNTTNKLYKYLVIDHFCKISANEANKSIDNNIIYEYYKSNNSNNIDHTNKILKSFFDNAGALLKMSLTESIAYLKIIFKIETDTFIIDFENEILKFSNKNSHNILYFLEEWDKKIRKESIAASDDINAIKLITIHKSKGLEFPIVIIPFLTWREKSSNVLAKTKKEPFNQLEYIPIKATTELENTWFEEYYIKEKLNIQTDSLNMLYVALTRAAKALFININYKAPKKSNDKKTFSDIADLVNECLNNNLSINPTLYNADASLFLNNVKLQDGILRIGEIPNNEEKNDNTIIVKELVDVQLKNSVLNYSKFNIKKNSIDLVEYINYDLENKISFGWVLHKIFSEIEDINNIDAIITNNISQGFISFEEAFIIKNIIDELLDNPTINSWFDKSKYKQFNEREILLKEFAVYRPDKVIIDGTKATIIDFKTGKKSKGHIEQLEHYASIVRLMGYEVEALYLLYLNPINLIKI
ncbi:MAG: hypothetical protein A2X12_07790 [Bacteroidetes bacterium GWE2_29_8]|nr:MAG: hypothetical protein A2X12_07790 [Bacteroidetes bacterium GWE2_29_8]OFY20369.1 MAG: hypothetical protein A2X02_08945 [Bacteroidetes bacterium GWF2_29_10]